MLIKITSVKIAKTIMKKFLRKSKRRVVKTLSRIRKALLNSLRSNGKQMLSKMKLIKLMMNTITCLKQLEIQLNRMNFPFVMIGKKLILYILNWIKAWLKSSSSWSLVNIVFARFVIRRRKVALSFLINVAIKRVLIVYKPK